MQETFPVDEVSEHGAISDNTNKMEVDNIMLETSKFKELDKLEIIEDSVIEESGLNDKVDRVIESDALYFKSLREVIEDEN